MSYPYYKFLDLQFKICDSFYVVESLGNFNQSRNKHWDQLFHLVSPEVFTFLKSKNIKLHNVELFYTAPYGQLPWHTDMNPPEDFVKINTVWGSSNHIMCYGEIKDKDRSFITSKTEVNSQYISFNENEIANSLSVIVDKPILINAGRPHKIINYGSDSRWCMSLILTKQERRILFDDALKIFSEYAVD